MSKFQIEVLGDLLIVTAPIAEFFAVYVKPTSEPQLLLKRRTQTDDYVLLAQAWRAANTKARELGWIVRSTDGAAHYRFSTRRGVDHRWGHWLSSTRSKINRC